jgi:hypothetical protein
MKPALRMKILVADSKFVSTYGLLVRSKGVAFDEVVILDKVHLRRQKRLFQN